MFLGLQPWLRALARCPHLLSLSRKIPSPDFPSKRRALSPSGPSCLDSPAELGHRASDSQGHVAKGKLPVSRHCLLCTYLCGCSRFRQPQRQLEPPAPSRPQLSIRAAVRNSVPVIWPRNSRRHKRLSGPTFCIRMLALRCFRDKTGQSLLLPGDCEDYFWWFKSQWDAPMKIFQP